MSKRKLQINKKHCKYSELEYAYDRCHDLAIKTKLLAILQMWDGLASTDVAKNFHKSDFYVHWWVHRYNIMVFLIWKTPVAVIVPAI